MHETSRRRFYHANFQGYLLAGLLTITPLIVVWLLFKFFLDTLSGFGRPLAVALTDVIDQDMPSATPWLAMRGCAGSLPWSWRCWRSTPSARLPRGSWASASSDCSSGSSRAFRWWRRSIPP